MCSTGIDDVAGCALIRRHTSKPSMSGRFTSRMMRSGCSAARRRASPPVAASPRVEAGVAAAPARRPGGWPGRRPRRGWTESALRSWRISSSEDVGGWSSGRRGGGDGGEPRRAVGSRRREGRGAWASLLRPSKWPRVHVPANGERVWPAASPAQPSHAGRTENRCARGKRSSFPGSAWERGAWQALPAERTRREAEPPRQCVPRRSLGTRANLRAAPGNGAPVASVGHNLGRVKRGRLGGKGDGSRGVRGRRRRTGPATRRGPPA